MNARDADAIALVAALPHRIGTRRSCKCEECRALRRVVALAREAAARKRKPAVREIANRLIDEHRPALDWLARK